MTMRRIALAAVLALAVAALALAAELPGHVVTETGEGVTGATVRVDEIPEISKIPVLGQAFRERTGSQDPGGTPQVTLSKEGGLFLLAPPTPSQSSVLAPGKPSRSRVRCAHGSARSDQVLIEGPAITSVGTIRLRNEIPCWKSVFTQACHRDIYWTAQPARVAMQAGAAADRPGEIEAQWALRKIGLPVNLARERLQPVTVAVIDSGLDWAHPHLAPENIWRNPAPGAEAEFRDDQLGWNFVGKNNEPWDDFGHGTFVTGLIVAVNPAARIMALKVLDEFGGTWASAVAQAIEYAVNRGARVINVSIGGDGLSPMVQDAVDYARGRGAVVVVAGGNGGKNVGGWGPANLRGVLAVAATDGSDRRAAFGNWGQQVALAAPGVDLVSLRARGSDFLLVASGGKDYTAGANITGRDRWLFRASGTSFSAPLVAGAASLLLARDANLTNRQVERMLVESADDLEIPGWDQFTGVGRLNVARALQADPNYHLTARVSRVSPVQERGQVVIQVVGTVQGSRLQRYEVQLGQGAEPTRWKTVLTERDRAVSDALLGTISLREITARGQWTIRLLAHDATGKTREARGSLNVQ
jgi:hypothetical protein